MTSGRRTMLNQRWNNVVYVNVEIYNVQQRWINVIIFNVDFHNVGQRQNNVANMTIWKKIEPRVKNKIMFLSFKEYAGLKILFFFPHFKRNISKNIRRASKILKTSNIMNSKTIFKPSHFVKCQLVFNFTGRQVQAHYEQ